MPVLIGDCLDSLKQIETESVDLVYLDPPFFTQKNHTLKTRKDNIEFSFEDTWDSINCYLEYIKNRLLECHRVLKKTGSIYLHCDDNASHYLRVLLDEVFGMDNFRNEIIWTYKRWTNSKNSLQCKHQNIYFYSKSSIYTFNTHYTDYSLTTNIDQILQERIKDEYGKSVYRKTDNGEIVWGKAKKGVPIGDVWDIPYLNPKAKERVGYPTQKPILLLERIIGISTVNGDTVLDPFCGSGTALVAAHLLGRRYIGIDISPEAIKICQKRLENPIKTTSFLLENGEEKYMNKTDFEKGILTCINAVPVQRNAGIDGFLKSDGPFGLIPVKIQNENESLAEAKSKLLSAAHKRGCKYLILVKTHNNMEEYTLFDNFPDSEDNIFLLESYEISINNWLNGIRYLRKIAASE